MSDDSDSEIEQLAISKVDPILLLQRKVEQKLKEKRRLAAATRIPKKKPEKEDIIRKPLDMPVKSNKFTLVTKLKKRSIPLSALQFKTAVFNKTRRHSIIKDMYRRRI